MQRTLLIITLFLISIINNFVCAQNIFEAYIPAENEIIFTQSAFPIDVIDPGLTTNLRGINYPGLRGANQLVIYTYNFGRRTNTNEFGAEAIVVDGIVTTLSGANSLIPVNGFVISGHGKAKKWINENIMPGTKVYINPENKTINSYITSDTFLYAAKLRIQEVQDMIAYYCKTYIGYNPKKAEADLNKAQEFVYKAQRNSEDAQKFSSKAIEYANSAMSNVIPNDYKELKGIWIRPTYFSKNDISKVLDNLSKNGIDNIFIETYYHGKTIFPSTTMEKYGFIKQYEDYIGFDPLAEWIEEAHKRNIKVHIWFQTFYVGNTPPETNSQYILAQKPQWANRQKKNANSNTIPYSVSEHNGYFIDPANPEVQNFLYELLDEIIQNYSPDGINLDYIRYPQSLSSNYSNYDLSNWGYTEFARNEFKNAYGADPINLNINDYLWEYWRLYRCSKVNNFVQKVGILCKCHNVMLTTVIFPNKKNALDTKLQDWTNWSINNYIDGFTPLFLTCDDDTVATLIEEVKQNKAKDTKLYAGLFVTFMKGSNTDLIKQIHTVRKYNLNGLILFDYAHLTDNYIDVLTQSVFKPVNKEINYQDNKKSVGQVKVKEKRKLRRKRERRK